mgnify:CR=1 FL=1
MLKFTNMENILKNKTIKLIIYFGALALIISIIYFSINDRFLFQQKGSITDVLVDSVSPVSVLSGSQSFNLTIHGSGFTADSFVMFNGNKLNNISIPTSKKIIALVPESAIVSEGTYSFFVTTGEKSSKFFQLSVEKPTSNVQVLTNESKVAPSDKKEIFINLVPVINNIHPVSAKEGDSSFTLVVNGSGFVSSSVIKWNGNSMKTEYINSNKVTTTIQSSYLLPGSYNVVVSNLPSNGRVSNSVSFMVVKKVVASPLAPSILILSPSSVPYGNSSFNFIIDGSGFTSESFIMFGNNKIDATYVSKSQLKVLIPQAIVATAGSYDIVVINGNNGEKSNTVYFVVSPSVSPSISSISPSSVSTGGSSFNLTVNGSGFLSSSYIVFNGISLTNVSSPSSTQITAVVPESAILNEGTYSVMVMNGIGGALSNVKPFAVTYSAVPTITSFSPSSITVGNIDFSLTIDGNGFTSASYVTFDGNKLKNVNTPTQNQIIVTVPQSAVSVSGSYPIVVYKEVGGTYSEKSYYAVNP